MPTLEEKTRLFSDFLNETLPKARSNNKIKIDFEGISSGKLSPANNRFTLSHIPKKIEVKSDLHDHHISQDWYKEDVTNDDYTVNISFTKLISFNFEIKDCMMDSYYHDKAFQENLRGFFSIFRQNIVSYLFKDMETSYVPGFITKSLKINSLMELPEGLTTTPQITAYTVAVDLAGYSTHFADQKEKLSEKMSEYYLNVFNHFRDNEKDKNLFKYRIKHLGDGHLSVIGAECSLYHTIKEYWLDHKKLVESVGFPELRIGISFGNIEFKVIKHGGNYDISDESIEFTYAKRCEDFAKMLGVSILLCDIKEQGKTFYLGRYYLEGFEEPTDLYSYLFEYEDTLDPETFSFHVKNLFNSNNKKDWQKSYTYLTSLQENFNALKLLIRFAQKLISEEGFYLTHLTALKKHKSIQDILAEDRPSLQQNTTDNAS